VLHVARDSLLPSARAAVARLKCLRHERAVREQLAERAGGAWSGPSMAVGAAVNELSEAQSLQMPIIVALMVPWVLSVLILREPNSAFSTAISFIPPVNTFSMLLRMTSTAPPPWWQVWLSIAIGVGSVFAALWFAAKVFRIGLLMYGKPPNFATLIRWARAA